MYSGQFENTSVFLSRLGSTPFGRCTPPRATSAARPGTVIRAPIAKLRRRNSSLLRSSVTIYLLRGSVENENCVGVERDGHAFAGRGALHPVVEVLGVDLDRAVCRLDHVLRRHADVRPLRDAAVEAVEAVRAEPDLLRA